MLADEGHRVVSQKRGASGDHLVQHGPQGVQVRSGGYLAAHGLLGGHVGHGSHHHAFGGQS